MTTTTHAPEILTGEELAQRLSVHPSTVKRWGDLGLIPVIRLPAGRGRRYDVMAVLARLEGSPSVEDRNE